MNLSAYELIAIKKKTLSKWLGTCLTTYAGYRYNIISIFLRQTHSKFKYDRHFAIPSTCDLRLNISLFSIHTQIPHSDAQNHHRRESHNADTSSLDIQKSVAFPVAPEEMEHCTRISQLTVESMAIARAHS